MSLPTVSVYKNIKSVRFRNVDNYVSIYTVSHPTRQKLECYHLSDCINRWWKVCTA